MRPTARSRVRMPVAARHPRAGVVVAGEEDEERVAAELQEHAAFGVRDGEQFGEARADDVGELFGTDPALACESLRQAGEAGDVDEDRGRVDLAPPAFGLVREPLVHQAGKERGQHVKFRPDWEFRRDWELRSGWEFGRDGVRAGGRQVFGRHRSPEMRVSPNRAYASDP